MTINMYNILLIYANAIFTREGVVLHIPYLCSDMYSVYDLLYMKTVLFIFVSLLKSFSHKLINYTLNTPL